MEKSFCKSENVQETDISVSDSSKTVSVRESEEESGEDQKSGVFPNWLPDDFEYVELKPIQFTADYIKNNLQQKFVKEESQSEELSDSDEVKMEKKKILRAKLLRKCELNLLDTLKCKDFLNKLVIARTVDGKYHLGLLKYLDPITGNLLITNTGKFGEIITFIHPEACLSVALLDEDDSTTGICKVEPILDMKRLKNRLIGWFLNNKIPIKVGKNDSLIVFREATINAPYGPQNCKCDNPTVLKRVKIIVQILQFKKHYCTRV